MKKRIYELSLMNILFCMMVIFIHVSSEPLTTLSKDSWQYFIVLTLHRGSSFVVQGFIFLSGFKLFLKSSDNFNYINFYILRLRDVVLPYVVWMVLYYLYFVEHDYFAFSIADLTSYTLKGNLVSHFYFIIIIIQFYLLAPLWHLIFKKCKVTVIIILSLLITLILGQRLVHYLSVLKINENFMFNDRVFTSYLIYWILGCAAGKNRVRFKEILKRKKAIIVISFLVMFVTEIALYYASQIGIYYTPLQETIHVLYCITAILFVYSMFNGSKIAEKLYSYKFVSILDHCTFSIYLCHIMFIYIANDIMYQHQITSTDVRYIIRTVTVYISSIAFALAWKALTTRKNEALKG